MKKILSNIYTLAALLMAGAAFTACSSDDNIIEQPQNPTEPQVYTMVIKASKGGDTTTRALQPGYDDVLGKNTVDAYWSGDETIEVYQNGEKIGTATAAPSADGNTTVTATLTSAPIPSNDLNFYLGGYNNVYTGQNGLLTGANSISEKYDYAESLIYSNAYSVEGNNVIPGENTTLNFTDGITKQAIIKFTLKDKGNSDAAISPTALTVTDGTSTVELTNIPASTYTANGAGVLYVAFPAAGSATITLTATVGSDTYTYTTPSAKTFVNGKYYEITVKMEKAYVNLSALTSNYTAQDGDVLKGSLNSIVKIEVAAGATVTLDGATINGVYSDNTYYWSGINCLGDATIILSGENTVKGFHCNCPGIYVPYGNKLIIQGSGSLNASSNGYGAGIGGGYNVSCGDIKIEGGNITATGGAYCAGIGGGTSGSTGRCGSIEITGGTINATGGEGAAGIGAGSNSICGNISISGGTITATGGLYAAGIGGSAGNSSTVGACGDISITGGTIDATGGNSSAGIGGGFWCGDITITSGVIRVTSTAGSSAPNSIGGGGGSGTHCGTVTIGSTVGAISKSPFTYPVTGHVLTSAVVGDIICSDGLAYAATDKDYLPSGVTAVAMVAYMGSASDCTNGLAIALEDVGTGMSWDNSNKNNGGKTAAELCDAWNESTSTKKVTGGTWRLPTIIDWQYMLIGCGATGTAEAEPSKYMNYDGLTAYLTVAGVSDLTSSYWSNTEINSNYVRTTNFINHSSGALFTNGSKTGTGTVRACLAF